MSKETKTYTSKEVGVILNNAVAAVLHTNGRDISEGRLRRLREYADAILTPLVEHLDGGIDEIEGAFGPCLDPEELVAILVTAALFVHLSRVCKTDRLPSGRVADLLFKSE